VVPPPPDQGLRQAEIDEMLSSLNAASPARSLEEPPAPDVLELTESMAAQEPHALNGGFRTIDGQSDLVFEDRPPEMELARHAPAPEPDALVSAATSAAVDSAFNTLAHTVLVQNARTLEDLVREMLRPLLKNWLDDNLPGLVERLVRAEIERVSRGRG
jgi:cell pole-organizing protein PopZ